VPEEPDQATSPDGYAFVNEFYDAATGFHAVVSKDAANNYIVAFPKRARI
jgi:hypothetical protein